MRSAASLGGVSNTAWSDWENGTRGLTPGMQHAVSKAFDWPITWPIDKLRRPVKQVDDNRVQQPAAEIDDVADLKERMARLENAVEALAIRATKTDGRARHPRPRPTDPTN